MLGMTKLSFRRGDREYVLDLNWDDDAFVSGNVAIEVIAGWRPLDGHELAEKVTATVMLQPSEDESHVDLVVEINGQECFRDDLALLFGEESVMGQIPPELFSFGDPILGCFIRSGISAAVSQILDCKERTVSAEWLWSRLRAIGSCLKENGVRIAASTFVRAGRCMIRG
jgi:hypothetical protein